MHNLIDIIHCVNCAFCMILGHSVLSSDFVLIEMSILTEPLASDLWPLIHPLKLLLPQLFHLPSISSAADPGVLGGQPVLPGVDGCV